MRFLVSRSSQGAVSKDPPCKGAIRGPESPAWSGVYEWYVELGSLEELLALMDEGEGGLGLFTPEEGEAYPAIEIFDEDEEGE